MMNTAELKKKGRAEKNLKRLQTLLNWALVSLQVGTFTLAATLKTIVQIIVAIQKILNMGTSLKTPR